jgi:cell division septation protein DedD
VQKTPVASAPQPRAAAATPPVSASASGRKQPAGAPHYAQLLSTSDQKTAEGLAAKLIDHGFTSAYVERGANEKGTIYRVRVKFPSEGDARAAEGKLKEFSKEVWITRQ